MHTFHDDASGVTIHYNSDLSGNCLISSVPGEALISDDAPLKIPGRVLLDFVAQFIVNERIAKLEQAGTSEILGVKVPS